MTDQGTTQSQDLVEVILSIGRLGRTGILTIQSDTEIIGISFHSGEMVAADALNQAQEDGFGEVLAEMGKITEGEYASLVAEYQAGGGRVMDLLTERSHLDRDELLDALSLYGYRLCREALSWRDYEYKFYQGQEVAYEEGVRPLPVEELLIRVAEDLGPEGPLPGELPVSESTFERTEVTEAVTGRDELLMGLATREGQATTRLLEQMDGSLTTERLAELVGISLYEARLALYLLVRTGQARITDAPPARGFSAPWGRKRRKPAESVLIPDIDSFSEPEPDDVPIPSPAGELSEVGETVSESPPWYGAADTSREGLFQSIGDHLPWIPRVLGLTLALAIFLTCWIDPGAVLLPFPWQEGLRQAVRDEQVSAAYLKIDRAANTSFLLDGHFPEGLDQLVDEGFLVATDLDDPSGGQLGYAAQIAGYLIYPLDEGEAAPGASRTETITGNFLLDPEFLPTRQIDTDPLVLLD